MSLRILNSLTFNYEIQLMELRVISIIPGHRGVTIETQDVNSIVLADSLGKEKAKNPLNVVHLLDNKGLIIKIYSK